MSEMTTNAASDDTLIRDSQLSGFASFKERLGFCCCRLVKKTRTYDLSSASKDVEEQQDKPSYVNQAFQREKQARKDKLDKIARTLPQSTSNGFQGTRTPTSNTQTPTRSLTTITQQTARSNNNNSTPTRAPMNAKTGIAIFNRPSPLAANTKINKKDSNETSTEEDSSEEESTSEDDNSSESDNGRNKKGPVKKANTRR
ncbi:unnamed protein product [Adineta steineri]|uniref:Uncharacterized protein n=1 Tax=Adineta steineri TaxID=433720 RepID=A0A813SM09_9BILA|nr:unnamed protein product [Adineta steineri]CAF3683747.1 unnamed protein product [Adineta steineri]